MPNVIAWPRVGLVGWEIARIDRANVEYGLLTNVRRTSAPEVRRRELVANVSALSLGASGSGYMAELIEQLDGGRHLIRINARSSIWYLRDAARTYANTLIGWTAGSSELLWTDGVLDMSYIDGMYPLYGVPGSSAGRPILTVSGFPPNVVVCRPSERLAVTDGDATEQARVVNIARSNGAGVAVLQLASAITISGLVSLGVRESIVCAAVDIPRAVQPMRGDWSYTWRLREVFAAETGAWVEVDPWQEISA